MKIKTGYARCCFRLTWHMLKKKQLICEVKSLDSNGFQYFFLPYCGKFPSVVECNMFDFEFWSLLFWSTCLELFLTHEANPLFVGASSYLVIYFRGKLIILFMNLWILDAQFVLYCSQSLMSLNDCWLLSYLSNSWQKSKMEIAIYNHFC